MAHLKEFNFRHQTAAPLESQCPPPPPPCPSPPLPLLSEASELASAPRGIISVVAGMRARQVAKNFQAEQPIDSQGDAC